MIRDNPVLILWLIGISVLIPLLAIVQHDNSVYQERLENKMAEDVREMNIFNDCDYVKENIEYWDKMILKPKKVVDELDKKYFELECEKNG